MSLAGNLLFVNPSPRKGRKHKAKRRHHRQHKRAAAQAAAPAAQHRRSRSRSRRKVRSFHIRAKRNPIMPSGFVSTQLKPAAIGAAGALANDVLVGIASKYLPPSLQTGAVRNVTKAGIAVLAGMLAQRFVGRDTVRKATVGALTCVMHDMAREQFKVMLPTVALGTIGDQIEALPDPYMAALSQNYAQPVAFDNSSLGQNYAEAAAYN
jgi:hypothetical protein